MVASDPTSGGGNASVVAVYETDEQARMGLDALRERGVSEDRITVVGAGEAEPDGAFDAADSPTAKGAARGALFGGITGALVVLAIPGAGLVVASGMIAAAGASIGVLAEVGVPTANVQDYEEDLTAGRYLLVVHGSAAEVKEAHAVLDMTDTEDLDLYG